MCSWGELQLPCASLEDSARSAGRSDPGAYQINASFLSPTAYEILCVLFKGEVSISPSPLVIQKERPH